VPRPFTRAQQRQNARFLAARADTGNARLAARALGVHRSTYTKRRARCPAFAAAWDEALAAARPHRRRPRGDGIDPAADAALFAWLEQGYSLRLAAETLGFAHSSFLARARADPAFAHELQVAAAIGRDRLLIADMDRMESAPDDGPDRPELPMPAMTVEEALHRIHLADPNLAFQRHVRRRRAPKPFSFYAPRIRAKLRAFARRLHFEATGSWRMPGE